MASERISLVLAVEVPTAGSAQTAERPEQLILSMAADNPIWGEARIADELQLKLGIRVSPNNRAWQARSSG
jgi:hypothetical protein